jgi:LacI family transcriptional regulator
MLRKRPTLRDVAKLAGVSKATAARVVNGDVDIVREPTRERVMKAVHKLGYERHAIAGSLRSARTNMLAVSIPDITNPFWPEVARGVQDTVEGAGYTVALMNNEWDSLQEQKHLKLMRQKQFDGLIINPTGTFNSDLLELRIPVVLLASGASYPDFDTVSSDSAQAGRLAMNHLIELGHQRIALIAGPSRRRKSYTHRDTYVRVCQENGLEVDPALMIETEFSQEGGYAALGQLMELRQAPTAVFAVNDIIALGALRAAQTAGVRVPEALSIIGMDDIFAAATTFPPLTTIAKPKYDIGTTAAHFLLERIDGKFIEEARHPLLPCTLVQRASTGQPAYLRN